MQPAKIYYNIEESDFIVVYNDFDFYFSSEFNKKRFKQKMKEYLKIENDKLNSKFGCLIDADFLLLYSLYKKIEKRGFLIKYRNKEMKYISFYVGINTIG